MSQTTLHGKAAFIMPHFGDTPRSREYLELAIDSVKRQSDPDWHLFIIDDGSPRTEDRQALASLADSRITVLLNEHRAGPGPARNLGIRHASSRQCPFVLFLDSDDLATPDRLALTRKAFAQQPEVDVVYSLFEAIDEAGAALDAAVLSPSIRVILEAISKTPPAGPAAWQQMATTFGYCNLTSTTAVRTALAEAVPFPAELVSDDMHTWFRYGGAGAAFYCIPAVTCGYRIPDPGVGSSCRRRFGRGFYLEKGRVDSDAFEQAVAMALAGERLTPEDALRLRAGFRTRLAAELKAEGEAVLAEALGSLDTRQIAGVEFWASQR